MKLTVKEQIRVQSNNPKVLEKLKIKLTKDNPEYHKLKRIDRPTYDCPKEIFQFEHIDDETLEIPRGTGKLARQIGRLYFDKVSSVEDLRSDGHEIDVELAYNEEFNELYSYQQSFVDVMSDSYNAVAVMPCGAGKTVSALALIAKLKRSALIIVHTGELLDQWKSEIGEKLEGDFKFGQLGRGIKKIGDITIATVQTLHRLKEKDFDYLSKQFGIVILDECHHCPANTFLKTVKSFYSRRLYGLSATPRRKDGKQFALYNYIGPIAYTVTEEELEDLDKLVPVHVKLITGGEFNYQKMQEDWPTLTREVSKHHERNIEIVENVVTDTESGRFPMVLCNRVKHAKVLRDMLRSEGVSSGLLAGEVSMEKRAEYKQLAQDGEIDCIICMDKIAGEGLDIKPISAVHIVFPCNNEAGIKQFVGRGRRIFGNKEFCLLYMYVDFLYFLRLGYKREHKLGKKIAENHRRWFKRWKFKYVK